MYYLFTLRKSPCMCMCVCVCVGGGAEGLPTEQEAGCGTPSHQPEIMT